MKKNACFRVSVDEVAENLAKFVALAKTQTFEIYDEGEVEVMLVRISAIPEWNENLQRSIRLDMLTEEAFRLHLANSVTRQITIMTGRVKVTKCSAADSTTDRRLQFTF